MKIFSVLVLLVWASCCHPQMLTHNEESALWREVQSKYSTCASVKMPTIEHTEEMIADKYLGLYFPNQNHVIVNSYFSKEVMRHEFNHACGDFQGEKIIIVKVIPH